MSRYTTNVLSDTPRLCIMFSIDERGRDTYQWGMYGAIPVFNLIGYISRVQAELLKPFPEMEPCDRKGLVIAYVSSGPNNVPRLQWYVNKEVPKDSLVGYLETVKQLVVSSQVAQHAAAQQVQLVGPDGQPIQHG